MKAMHNTIIAAYNGGNRQDIAFVREIASHWDEQQMLDLLTSFKKDGWTMTPSDMVGTGQLPPPSYLMVRKHFKDKSTHRGWFIYSKEHILEYKLKQIFLK